MTDHTSARQNSSNQVQSTKCTAVVVSEKRLGLLEGRLDISDDFDAPLPDHVAVGFYGDEEP